MWVMRHIKRQFGPYLARLFSLSPTLVRDLKTARERGISIRRDASLKAGAWCDANKNTIYIGTETTAHHQIVLFAHEFEHILRGKARGSTRQAFISSHIAEEVNCIIAEIKVMDELIAQGETFWEGQMDWHRAWSRGGRAAIKKALLEWMTCDGIPYREHYSREFDKLARAA